ncbi:hypothetical protein ABTE28_20510, partial [Acinetobacter baumannii]
VEILQNPALAGAAKSYTQESLLNEYPPLETATLIPSTLTPTHTTIHPSTLNPTPSTLNPAPSTQPVILHENDLHEHEEVDES